MKTKEKAHLAVGAAGRAVREIGGIASLPMHILADREMAVKMDLERRR